MLREFAAVSTNGTKKCITVSTLNEAEFYADGGFDDITYAYPVTADKLTRCAALCDRLEAFHVLVDPIAFVDELEKIRPQKKKWSVLLSVDCGYGREGVLWEDIDASGQLCERLAASENIIFRGLYTHDGHSYNCKGQSALKKHSEDAAKKMSFVSKQLKDKFNVICEIVGLGSTPSCSQPSKDLGQITEFHPGNYVFYDVMQSQIGSCTLDDIACRVATRVINHRADCILIDCGFVGLSQDGKTPDGVSVVFQGHPELRLVGMCQEIGKVSCTDGSLDFDKYPVGHMLFIYPWHACATAAMHPMYFVHKGDAITGTVKPTRGW